MAGLGLRRVEPDLQVVWLVSGWWDSPHYHGHLASGDGGQQP